MDDKLQEKCYYLGKAYPIIAQVDPSEKKMNLQWDGKTFTCKSPEAGEIDCYSALRQYYIKAGKKIISERLKIYQPQIKVRHKAFVIEDSLKKWGSCSSDRQLMFNWKLMMFPIEVIDYVVVHELCHLMHMNHDRSFWRLLGKIYPNYKDAMAILGTEKTRDL